jgi:C4-dicarboxylate-specific signal transduction histidine kinase
MFPAKQRLSHFFSSIRFRLILLVLLSIIPALIFILYGAIEQRQYNIAAAEKTVDHYVRHIALYQDRLIVQIKELLFTLTETAELKNRDASACSELFARILKQNKEYANIGAIDRSGKIFASAVPLSQPVNVADRPYFQRVLQTRQYSVGNYQVGRITGKPGINLAYPILDKSGEVETVVYVLLPIEALKKMAATEELPAGATLTMLDANGTVLSRNLDPEKWEGKNLQETEIIHKAMAQGHGPRQRYDGGARARRGCALVCLCPPQQHRPRRLCLCGDSYKNRLCPGRTRLKAQSAFPGRIDYISSIDCLDVWVFIFLAEISCLG